MKIISKKFIYFFFKFLLPKFIKIKLLSDYTESNLLNNKKNNLMNYFQSVYFTYVNNVVYFQEPNPEIRIDIQKLCFAGKDGGVQYAKNEEDNGSKKFIEGPKFKPILEEIDILKKQNNNKNFLIIQIGSSNGRKIKHLAEKYKEFTLIGIDIFENIISYSNDNNRLNNLSFVKCYAHEIDELISKKKFDICIMFSSGSSQYIQPEHLEIFFKKIRNFKNIYLMFCEGFYIKNKKNLFLGNSKSFCNFAFHFSHNYDHYANEAGLNVKKMLITEENNSCEFIATTNAKQ